MHQRLVRTTHRMTAIFFTLSQLKEISFHKLWNSSTGSIVILPGGFSLSRNRPMFTNLGGDTKSRTERLSRKDDFFCHCVVPPFPYLCARFLLRGWPFCTQKKTLSCNHDNSMVFLVYLTLAKFDDGMSPIGAYICEWIRFYE